MVKGLYILDQERLDEIFGPEERAEIERTIEIIAPPQTRASIAAVPDILRDVEVIISGPGMVKMNDRFLGWAPSLKAVFHAGESTGEFVTDQVARRGIIVTSAAAVSARRLAESRAVEILFFLEHSTTPSGAGPRKKRAGLLSFGLQGRAVREKLRDFDVQILVCDPTLTPAEAAEADVELCELEDIFSRGDVIDCDSPWLEKSGRVIGQTEFSQLKAGATLIVSAGSEAIDLDELFEMLRQRPDLRAVLEVTDRAALAEDARLQALGNLILSEQSAAQQKLNEREIGRCVVEEVKRYATAKPSPRAIVKPVRQGETPPAPLPPARGSRPIMAEPEAPSVPEFEDAAEATERVLVAAGPAPTPAKRHWWRRKEFLAISIIVHLLFGAFATYLVVSRYAPPRKLTFKGGPPSPNPSLRAIEHKVDVAKKNKSASPPLSMKRIAVAAPTRVALPAMPDLPTPVDSSFEPMTGMPGTGGFGQGGGTGAGGMGMGTGTGLGGGGSPINFFGIKAAGKRIVLLFDVSGSVVNKAQKAGVPISRIKEETIKLIDGLTANSSFSIIQFVRHYKMFRDELIPASDPNKEAARKWVNDEWAETGTMGLRKGVTANSEKGVIGVLEKAYAMKPDTIFLISDGSFQRTAGDSKSEDIPYKEVRKVVEEFGKAAGKFVPIHFIGFEMKRENESEMKRLVGATGGKLREVKGSD